MKKTALGSIACVVLLAAGAGLAMGAATAPAGPASGPADSQEAVGARRWAQAALLGLGPPKGPPKPGLDLRRQDYGKLRRNRSVMDTPLQIGTRKFARGLGTHSVSEILVRLPAAGGRLEAAAGVDNNYDTAGKNGSVVFVVEVGGKAAYRSAVHRGGQEPLAVRVDLKGARELTLRVLDANDGPGFDQADWAEAFIMMEDGKQVWLDELADVPKAAGFSTDVPFSFTYGGKASAELLGTWKRTHVQHPPEAGRQRHTVTYADPAGGLEVACEVTLFEKFPAVEWLLRFRNAGSADTPILANILPLDLHTAGPVEGEVVLHRARGSMCTAEDFLPIDQPLPPKSEVRVAPDGGRSSNGQLPFFNLAWADGGLAAAIGWSGQWELLVRRADGGAMSVQAGQQKTHLLLHAGESIRTPRMLLVSWRGPDRLRGHNLLRRVILEHYVPRLDGQPVLPPVTQNTWFVYNSGNDVTEQNQLEIIRSMAPLGVEAYWLDAGWFEGGWPSGVGSWVPRADAFPRGLRPLGEAAHKLGMKFVVWFEPERVSPNSRIGKEHPEWVLHAGAGDGLFNLGDPAGRKWLTDLLSKVIGESGIDVYRNDFNIEPLPFWRGADAADRQGMAEIRYVEGLYEMWDELRRRHAGLFVDNCASGGRRIDLETVSRSLPLWRSDSQCCGRAMPTQDQAQTAGLSLYVPLHSAGCWGFDPYTFRSVATTGLNVCVDTRAKDFPAALAKAAIAEAKALRPYYLGDYYPLLAVSADERHWCGWQFDRPDLGGGLAVVFRRPGSPYAAADVALRGLEAAGTYDVSFAEGYDVRETKRMTGADLAHLRVTLATATSCVLIRYQKAK